MKYMDMKNIVKFRFVPIAYYETGDEILVKIDSHGEQIDYPSIEDAISSYIEGKIRVPCLQLIEDVLGSFGYDYKIIQPEHVFEI